MLTNRVCLLEEGKVLNDDEMCIKSMNSSSCCAVGSGWPLVIQRRNGANIQIGVTKGLSQSDCKRGKAIVFTKITNVIGWIKETVSKNNVRPQTLDKDFLWFML